MDDFYTRWLEESRANREAVAAAPRVARGADLVWVRTPQDARAALMVAPEVGFPTGGSLLSRAAIPPGWQTGRHAHGEEAIYVEEGDGLIVLDGLAYEFHPGTVIHVPFRAEHQLVNTGDREVAYISSTSWPVERASHMGFIDQLEEAGEVASERVASIQRSVSQCWPPDGRRLTLHREQYVRAPYSNHGETYYLMRGKQLREANGFRTVGTSVSHIFVEQPHSRSHKHAHPEAYLYVLEGRGYSIMDGQRYEWEKGDVVHVPPGMVEHQHFNPTDEIARELRFEFGLRYWFVDQFEGYRTIEREGGGHEGDGHG
jgi:gentisate 1,2-dioxygenase